MVVLFSFVFIYLYLKSVCSMRNCLIIQAPKPDVVCVKPLISSLAFISGFDFSSSM